MPIITSLLDTDFYKFSMAQVVDSQFCQSHAAYKFINRGKTEFPVGFSIELNKEVNHLSKLSFTCEEAKWLEKHLHYGFVESLSSYQFDPEEVNIKQTGGNLEIDIRGLWRRTILWEVPLMAIISELYFKMTNKIPDTEYVDRMRNKAKLLHENGVQFIDFSTRRRFSKEVQEKLNEVMCFYYLGTSNPYFAKKFNVRPIGTVAHEFFCGMQAKYGFIASNRKALEHWYKEYNGQLGIALTDTLTTDVFLRDFDREMALEYDGVRQDSGSPEEFAEKLITHYKKLEIDPKTRKIVFSDSLNTEKAIALHKRFSPQIPCVMGIGTHFSNDCGHKPLNMVIKMVGANFGEGWKPVVKLSDDVGKNLGDKELIDSVKKELGI